MTDDPFAHHPGLRDKIADPVGNFFRNMTLADLDRLMRENGLRSGWWYPEETREERRRDFMAPHSDDDLWVFAYGSLMWDPGFHFAEVRRAALPGHARRFILRDIYGGRGTPEAPGLMAALDAVEGQTCDGLVFRIAQPHVEAESQQIWKREMIAPAYTPVMVPVSFADQQVQALTFVADHEAELIAPAITRAEQVSCLLTGGGFLGTSLEYLENIATHFDVLGIRDDEVVGLLAAVEDRRLTGQ